MSSPSRHWADWNEVTFETGIRLLFQIHRWLGRWPFLLCLWPVVAVYWAVHAPARRASRDYLRRWRRSFPDRAARAPGSFGHFVRFADVLLDKLLAASGRFARQRLQSVEMDAVRPLLAEGRGALLVTAHVGCLELCQAAADAVPGLRLNVLVHTRHAERFNRLLARLRPQSQLRLLQVTEVTPATAVDLAERIGRGEFVAIVGDRVPVHGGRTVRAELLGDSAEFPAGPWVLASLLRCPVLLLSCVGLAGSGRYRLRIEPLAERIELPRAQREAQLQRWVTRYAQWLQGLLRDAPADWFNFFDFWGQGGRNERK